MTIAEIVEEYAFPTDKTCGYPSGHSYGPFYDAALAPYRDRAGIRLLEIGVACGGSLRLWRTYFKDAEITGVDIAPMVDAFELGSVATLVKADAYSPKVAAQLGTFDVIIDDGPHTLESMIAAVQLYLPRLRPGGLMVIEDVPHPEWASHLELAVKTSAVGSAHAAECINLTVPGGIADDRLFVIYA